MDFTQKKWDLVIIGAGIAGAAAARESAKRGYSTLLIEKDQIGSGTSSKSSKLIHGGIRYLENAWIQLKKFNLSGALKDFAFVFHSLKECRLIERDAPELVKLIPILIPVYKGQGRSLTAVCFGSFLYGCLALFGGGGKMPQVLLGKERVLKKVPELDPNNLIGAAIIWDRLTDDKKLTEHVAEKARQCGVHIVEKCALNTYSKSGGGYELSVKSGENNQTIRASQILLTCGAWTDKVRHKSEKDNTSLIHPVAGCHLHIRDFLSVSVLLQAKDRRVFFAIKTDKDLRIGTTERIENNPDNVRATDSEIDYLIDSFNRYFPGKKITSDAILHKDAGIRPLYLDNASAALSQISRDHKMVRSDEGIWQLIGVKLTDHNRAAKDALRQISKTLAR